MYVWQVQNGTFYNYLLGGHELIQYALFLNFKFHGSLDGQRHEFEIMSPTDSTRNPN